MLYGIHNLAFMILFVKPHLGQDGLSQKPTCLDPVLPALSPRGLSSAPGQSGQQPGARVWSQGAWSGPETFCQGKPPEALTGEQTRLPSPKKFHCPLCSGRLWSFPQLWPDLPQRLIPPAMPNTIYTLSHLYMKCKSM